MRPFLSHRLLVVLGVIAMMLGWEAQTLAQEPSAPTTATTLKEQTIQDIAYGADPAQRLDLFVPSGRPFPVIVCIYGGGWHGGSGKSWRPIGAMLREKGFGAVVISHRLHPPHLWPAHEEDVAGAVDWVVKHIEEFGGDPKRIAVLGHSSGAQLALLIALDGRYLAKKELRSEIIRGVAALSPPTDLAPRGDGTGYGDVLMAGRGADVFSRDSQVMRDASPIAHVEQRLPPILLVVGDHDFPMLASDTEKFRTSCMGESSDVTVLTATNKDHMGVAGALLEDGPVQEAVIKFLRRVTQ